MYVYIHMHAYNLYIYIYSLIYVSLFERQLMEFVCIAAKNLDILYGRLNNINFINADLLMRIFRSFCPHFAETLQGVRQRRIAECESKPTLPDKHRTQQQQLTARVTCGELERASGREQESEKERGRGAGMTTKSGSNNSNNDSGPEKAACGRRSCRRRRCRRHRHRCRCWSRGQRHFLHSVQSLRRSPLPNTL